MTKSHKFIHCVFNMVLNPYVWFNMEHVVGKETILTCFTFGVPCSSDYLVFQHVQSDKTRVVGGRGIYNGKDIMAHGGLRGCSHHVCS